MNIRSTLLPAVLVLLGACRVNSAHVDNALAKYFDSAHVDGCFALYNNKMGEITVYNMKLDTQRVLPASTFKIVNSLIGLETGKIIDENMVIRWDGVTRPDSEWNRDLTMQEAFRVSAVPYYQEVARRIGKPVMQHWIDTLHYGNMDIRGPVDSFWLNNTLKISPDEQLGLVEKLYFDKLPFTKRSQAIVRNVMLRESNTLYKLSYKTGWGFDENHHSVGWVVGWIEENMHPYFFVTLVKTPDQDIDMPKVRMAITRGILSELGFFRGEK